MPEIDDVYENFESDSWFDIGICENPNPYHLEEYITDTSQIPVNSYMQQMKTIRYRKLDKVSSFICTKKIRIYPTIEQQFILREWFKAATSMFNITVRYVQQNIFIRRKLIEIDSLEYFLNNTDFRYNLKEDRDKITSTMYSPIAVHILDEMINLAISNFKSYATNFKKGHIKKFRIRPWSYDRRRYIIKIEKNLFSGGTFCPRTFPSIESSEPLGIIDSTVTLQYDSDTKKYILLVPSTIEETERVSNNADCGIDLGVRTFATVYSNNEVVTIGNDPYKKFIDLHNKIDRINQLLSTPEEQKEVFVQKKIIKKKKIKKRGRTEEIKIKRRILVQKKINRVSLRKARRKYFRKISDIVRDLHFKAAYFLVNRFDSIYVGKLSTRKILLKNNRKITKKTKRMIGVLSPYAFRQILLYMGDKYGAHVLEVDEYLTTKTCPNCGRINEIGASKVHICQCGMKTCRDAVGGKNHNKVGYIEDIANVQEMEALYSAYEDINIIRNNITGLITIYEV